MFRCTVGIPVYNRNARARQLVCRAIESALAQDVEGLEILVVDDCSTDGTWDLLLAYSDPRVRLVRNERNIGLFANFSKCLQLARGTYVRLLCSDDQLVEGCLAREMRVMDTHPEVALLSARGREIDAEGRYIRTMADYFPPGVYRGRDVIAATLEIVSQYANTNPFNYPSGILMRRDVAREAGDFDNSYRLVGDLDYWFRMLCRGDLAVCEHLGCEVTIHAEQQSALVARAGETIEELFRLTERWAPVLDERRPPIASRLRALTVLTALSMALRGRNDTARIYWQQREWRQGSWIATTASLFRLTALKALWRLTGFRVQPLVAAVQLRGS